MPKRSCAFSMPMATAANETRGRNGSMTRVSRTVDLDLARDRSKPGASARDERPREDEPERPPAPPRTTASSVSSREASWCARSRPPSASARA